MNVLEKMGTFSTVVKRYVKTVNTPVSDHGGLFVKKVRIHSILEEKLRYVCYDRREVTICMYSVVPCDCFKLTEDMRLLLVG